MPLRRKGKTQGSQARVLTAAGQLITPSTADAVRVLRSAHQPWQEDAWAYRELIPELRYGTQFMAHAVSMATFFPAQVNHKGGDPIPFDSKECTLDDKAKKIFQEEHERLPLASGMQFIGRMVENLQIPAECFLHSFEESGTEQWRIRSTSELTLNPGGKTAIVTEEEGGQREFSLEDEDVIRLWYPHARKRWEPDSALRPMLDVCEDIVLAGKEQRAAARSRVAANGLLLIPSGMVMLGGVDDQGQPIRRDASDSRFVQDFLAQLMAPLRNEGDPGAVAPVMLVGDAQDIDKLKHLTFVRETSGDLGEKITRSLRRLSTGLDMPGELITGMADVNHWTAWQIDAGLAKYHVGPWARVASDSMTGGFLRPAGRARDLDDATCAQVQYHYDLGAITENPNRREDAKDAWDRGLISDQKARDDLGYDEGDRPDDKELVRRLAFKIGVSPDLAAKMLEVVLGKTSGMHEVIEVNSGTAPGPQTPPGTPNPAALPPGEREGGLDEGAAPAPAGANAQGGGAPNNGVPAGGAGRENQATSELEALSDKPVRPQKCHHCPKPAVSSIIWAEGRAYVPHCAAHRARVVSKIGGESEIDAERPIVSTKSSLSVDESAVGSRAGNPTLSTHSDLSPTGWGVQVDVEACRDLATIERAVRERLMQAGDDAIERAVERAGNRLRNQARRTSTLEGLLDGVDALDIGLVLARLPADQLAGLDMQTGALLDGALDSLRPKFLRWVGAAIDSVVQASLRILGVRSALAADRARERMHAQLGDGWNTYRDHLLTRAERRLWKPDELEVPARGEAPDTITTPEGVRKALSVVGGEDDRQAGLSAGRTIHNLMTAEGADDLGYEWAYGVLPRRPFPPHQRLHGRRFANWTSPVLATAGTGGEFVGDHFHPGDHGGCMCDYVYLWALAVLGPRADPQAAQEAAVAPQENEAQRNHRLLLESDRAAGRTNTTVVADEAERQKILARARRTYEIEESA